MERLIPAKGDERSEITWGPRDRKTVGFCPPKNSSPLFASSSSSYTHTHRKRERERERGLWRSYDNHVIARVINQLKTTKVTTPSEFRTRYHLSIFFLLSSFLSFFPLFYEHQDFFLLRSTWLFFPFPRRRRPHDDPRHLVSRKYLHSRLALGRSPPSPLLLRSFFVRRQYRIRGGEARETKTRC